MRRLIISIHAPARGATQRHAIPNPYNMGFQSTLPRGERPVAIARYTLAVDNFNPRSREGSDVDMTSKQSQIYKISIHAPARGATIITLVCKNTIDISIHAPARGATASRIYNCSECVISIHAPARGATQIIAIVLDILEFQSTLPGAT